MRCRVPRLRCAMLGLRPVPGWQQRRHAAQVLSRDALPPAAAEVPIPPLAAETDCQPPAGKITSRHGCL